MNPSERHFDSHTFFISSFSSSKRAWQWKRGVWKGGGCQLMQVTRVLKFIVSCSQAAKIYTMNTLARQAHSQGASWRTNWNGNYRRTTPHTSGHVYMDDMFALCAVRPYPWVCLSLFLSLSLCVCVRICVAVFECLSWHENSQARPCRMCDSAHTHTHTYISVNGSCQHDSYKDNNTNVTDVCRAGQDMFSWGNSGNYRNVHLLNLNPERMRQRQKFPSIPFMV